MVLETLLRPLVHNARGGGRNVELREQASRAAFGGVEMEGDDTHGPRCFRRKLRPVLSQILKMLARSRKRGSHKLAKLEVAVNWDSVDHIPHVRHAERPLVNVAKAAKAPSIDLNRHSRLERLGRTRGDDCKLLVGLSALSVQRQYHALQVDEKAWTVAYLLILALYKECNLPRGRGSREHMDNLVFRCRC